MKARKNPTIEQLARRMWRDYPASNPNLPVEKLPQRAKNDPYWALRCQGHPASYAKRAFRDQLPVIYERTVSTDTGEYEPDEILFEAGSTSFEMYIEVRPELSETTIPTLAPRASEYTVWDAEVRGFGVRVRPSGHITYIMAYRIRYQKRLHKHTIGRITEFSLEQARCVAREIRRDARMGIDPTKRMR